MHSFVFDTLVTIRMKLLRDSFGSNVGNMT